MWSPPFLIDRLNDQCAGHPRATALVDDANTFTWRQLADSVEAVAERLTDVVLPRSTVVGIPAGRDARSLINILGVSRAGLTPLPVDRSQPAARTSAQLRSAAAGWLTDDGGVEPAAPETAGPGLGRAAYALATSGSMGEPKVVSVGDHALRRYARGLTERLGVSEPVSALLLYPLCVDIGMTAVVAAFATGGTLHVLGDHAVRDPQLLTRYVAEHNIDLLKITPSHLFAVQQGDPIAAVPRRFLVLGGEPLPSPFARALVRDNPGCAVYNHYGPSETAIGVLMHRLGEPVDADGPVPLGQPLRGVGFVVDARSELLIRIDEFDLGYLGNPRETARRFIPDAGTTTAPGARVFRSGDEVQIDAAGRPVFVSRLDDQTKVRGFRIELGEIDATLRSLDSVADAAAAVDGQRIVAVVVSAGTADPPAIISAVRTVLPEPMVPHHVVVTGAVPRGASGKVDRSRVVELVNGAGQAPEPRPEPTGLAAQILDVLADTLGSDDMTAEADFFEHGGDSLLAMTAVWQIRLETGIEVTLADLVRGRSARGLAQLLDAES